MMSTSALRSGSRGRRSRRIRRTRAGRIPALGAPVLRRGDGEFTKAVCEVSPRDRSVVASEKRVRDWLAGVRGRAIVEEEADLQVADGGEAARGDRGVGEELEHHGAGVAGDAHEVGVCGG